MSVGAMSARETGAGQIEHITSGDEKIALICRASYSPASTKFLTPSDYKQQLGFIVYPAGGVIQAHTHKPLERTIVGTSEVLVVRSGRLEVDFFNSAREPIATRVLETGDLVLLTGGGHGFKMLEDTVLLEVKQGPYTGVEEKDRFQP